MRLKKEVYAMLEKADKDSLVRAICHWFETNELDEFIDFLASEEIISRTIDYGNLTE